MLFSTFLAVATVACSFASAAPTRREPEVEGPFGLQIISDKPEWNEKFMSHTHIGAAYNLAIPSIAPEAYYLNTTEGNSISYKAVPWIPYHLNVGIDMASNMGALYVSVDYPTYNFKFDAQDYLKIGGLERWFICTVQTNYGPKCGISWEYGTGEPSVADCTKIRLQKVKIRH